MDMETVKGLVDPEMHGWLDNIHEMCNAPYAVNNGIELVSARKNVVIMRKKVFPHDLNSNGVVHGATSFGLIDHTFAVICNMDYRTVGLSCNIVYHRPCFGGVLEAEAVVINESRSLVTVGVSLRCEDKLIATATAVGFKAERPKK
ncbi:MAG: PaaI family thioesterase [Candidatus Methanoplasma sp.]|jgi:acyl-CoA thioesterase|nr:PaaI family thioesterase [Candidatus Methanoplasma sp.]